MEEKTNTYLKKFGFSYLCYSNLRTQHFPD
jgi:hypothetical protein